MYNAKLNDLNDSMINIISQKICSYIEKYDNLSAEVLLEQLKNKDSQQFKTAQYNYLYLCNDIVILQKILDLVMNMPFKTVERFNKLLSKSGVYCDGLTLFVDESILEKKSIDDLTFASLFEIFLAFQNTFATGNYAKANSIYATQCMNIIYDMDSIVNNDMIMDVVKQTNFSCSYIKAIKCDLNRNDIIYFSSKEQYLDRKAKTPTNLALCDILFTIEENGYKGMVLDIHPIHRYNITSKVESIITSMFLKDNSILFSTKDIPSNIYGKTIGEFITAETVLITNEIGITKLRNDADETIQEYKVGCDFIGKTTNA